MCYLHRLYGGVCLIGESREEPVGDDPADSESGFLSERIYVYTDIIVPSLSILVFHLPYVMESSAH